MYIFSQYYNNLCIHPTAPSQLEIEGDESSRQVVIGDSVRLTCRVEGGFPLPLVQWFRDEEEQQDVAIETELEVTRAHLDLVVQEMNRNAVYRCQASNFATSTPLNDTVSLTVIRGTVHSLLSVSQFCFPSQHHSFIYQHHKHSLIWIYVIVMYSLSKSTFYELEELNIIHNFLYHSSTCPVKLIV